MSNKPPIISSSVLRVCARGLPNNTRCHRIGLDQEFQVPINEFLQGGKKIGGDGGGGSVGKGGSA